MLKHEEIDRIFKAHLKIESKVMSIESLFTDERRLNKIDYKPYFQRNYVWDKDKATYFIESILIGTEIPPLVFFNNYKKVEIIDGRQRFETIKNFIDKKLALSKQGLHALKSLHRQNFDDLDIETKGIFLDTKIRILEFSIVNEPKLDDRKEDLIKKEIFRRYNSGITPLKKSEIEKAIYIDDDLTSYFKKSLKKNIIDYKTILSLLFTDRDLDLIHRNDTLDKVMTKIRQLLVLHNVPIKMYSGLSNRNDMLSLFYELLSNQIGDVEEYYLRFIEKIKLCNQLSDMLANNHLDLYKNKLIYECTFWILSILETEIPGSIRSIDKNFLNQYAIHLNKHSDKFSEQKSFFYKNVNERYYTVARFFEEIYDIKFDLYLDDYSGFKEKVGQLNTEEPQSKELIELENIRINKPEPISWTINDICSLMNRDKFLIRPTYQREEVMNKIKSSALIESILLGIKLPPIFLFKRRDGIHEVIDGQQRLLSILGFIGREFINEEGKKVKSEKNKYKLTNLRILSEYDHLGYDDLEPDLKDKILDFDLAVVIIDEKLNPNFDKIDLFIRLNNKPYPIRENSFEMWNSYIDKDIINKIKEITARYSTWFYLYIEKKNSRMDNEELYTSLSYLAYKRKIDPNCDYFQILNVYQKADSVNARLKSKSEITKTLNDASDDEDKKELFINCINEVVLFIEKVKMILIENSGTSNDDYLRSELNHLFYSKSSRRTTQSFYSLWLVLSEVNISSNDVLTKSIKKDIQNIFYNMKNLNNETAESLLDDTTSVMEKFRNTLSEFKSKYQNKK